MGRPYQRMGRYPRGLLDGRADDALYLPPVARGSAVPLKIRAQAANTRGFRSGRSSHARWATVVTADPTR
jgi:hypothetical protein